jgi:hypothetical protein
MVTPRSSTAIRELSMVDKVFEDIAVAAPRYAGNARRAIDFGLFQSA